MSESRIPGITTKHAVIRDGCRTGRGEMEAFNEAVARIREEYVALCRGWPVGKGAQFHLVLTLEKPAPQS
jgi:hypothetical protein